MEAAAGDAYEIKVTNTSDRELKFNIFTDGPYLRRCEELSRGWSSHFCCHFPPNLIGVQVSSKSVQPGNSWIVKEVVSKVWKVCA